MEKESRIRCLMDQVLCVNQILGVFPHETAGSLLIFRWKSMTVFKTILNLLIFSLYAFYLCVRFIQALAEGENIVIFVQIWFWLTVVTIPIFILILCFMRRDDIRKLFECSDISEENIRGFVDAASAFKYSRNIYKVYILMAVISSFLFGYESYIRPRKPYSLLYYVKNPTGNQIIANCVFMSYITLVSSAALSIVEVLCPSLAISMVSSIYKIKDALVQDVRQATKKKEADSKIMNDLEKSTPALILQELEFRPHGNPVMRALGRYSKFSQFQSKVNCIFGQILALNTACLLISLCLLWFLEIRLLSPRPGQEVHTYTITMVIWSAVTCVTRLMIILVTVGRVYHAGKCFEATVTGCLLELQKSKSLDLHLSNIQLISYQINPVAFSAGGFFVFSRATILCALSVITTYVVFLLQA